MNYSLENLKVWQSSRELVKEIHQITSSFPQDEIFGLAVQLRIASLSVSNNTTEGSIRWSKTDQSKYYQIAFSDLIVVLNQLILATHLNYLQEDQLAALRTKIDSTGKLLRTLTSNKSKVERLKG